MHRRWTKSLQFSHFFFLFFLFFLLFFFFFLFCTFFSLFFCLQCTTEPNCTIKWASIEGPEGARPTPMGSNLLILSMLNPTNEAPSSSTHAHAHALVLCSRSLSCARSLSHSRFLSCSRSLSDLYSGFSSLSMKPPP